MHGTGLMLTAMLALQPAGAPPDREAPIRALVQRYLDARDRNDAAELRGLFVAEVDQLVSSGEWREGREALVGGTLANSKRTGGQRAIRLVKVRFIAPDTAVADGQYDLTGQAGSSRHMWTTFVLVRTPEGWRIAAIRNMLPAPPAPGRAGA